MSFWTHKKEKCIARMCVPCNQKKASSKCLFYGYTAGHFLHSFLNTASNYEVCVHTFFFSVLLIPNSFFFSYSRPRVLFLLCEHLCNYL